jgi:branched-chain amino acid transport system substrate-binding protein
MRRIALIALMAVLLGGSGGAWAAKPAAHAADPGITATTIKLGGVLDQTGRGTVISLPILGGYDLAIKQINAQGGINGRKIVYVAKSDNYDPSQTLPQLRDVVESENVFAVLGVFGSDDAAVAAPYLEQRHIPFFDPIGGGVDVHGKQWIWQTEPDYVREGKVMAKYAASVLHARRVAVLYQVGIGEGQVAAIKQTLPKYHASLVADAGYQSTDSNLAGQVQRLRGANPDLVILNGTPTPTASFVVYARQLGFTPKYGFIANYPMGDPLWLALIGASSAEGNHVSSYADLTGHNIVARAYRAAIAKYSGQKYSNYGLYGYFNAMLFFKALKLAGKTLTRARLQHVLDYDFRHYDTGFTGRINWTPAQHYGARQFKMYKIHNGSFIPVTGWLNP